MITPEYAYNLAYSEFDKMYPIIKTKYLNLIPQFLAENQLFSTNH